MNNDHRDHPAATATDTGNRQRPCLFATAAALLATVLAAGSAFASESTPLSLDALFATPSLTGTAPSAPLWSPDSKQLAFAWNSDGQPQRRLFIAARDGRDVRRVGGEDDASPAVLPFLALPLFWLMCKAPAAAGRHLAGPETGSGSSPA